VRILADRVINVLHLIETSEPGGSETILSYIAKNLTPERYKSLVLVLREGWLTQRLRDQGVEYLMLESKYSYDPFFLLIL
jgi:hypothetical protein